MTIFFSTSWEVGFHGFIPYIYRIVPFKKKEVPSLKLTAHALENRPFHAPKKERIVFQPSMASGAKMLVWGRVSAFQVPLGTKNSRKTPWKLNGWRSENHLFEKENHLNPNLTDFGFHVNFPGCTSIHEEF